MILKGFSCLNNILFDNFVPISVLPMPGLNNEGVVLCWRRPHRWNEHFCFCVGVDARESNCHNSAQTLRSVEMSECSASVLAQRGHRLSYWQGLFLSRAALTGLSKSHANKCPSMRLSITTIHPVTKCLLHHCWIKVNKLVWLGGACKWEAIDSLCMRRDLFEKEFGSHKCNTHTFAHTQISVHVHTCNIIDFHVNLQNSHSYH